MRPLESLVLLAAGCFWIVWWIRPRRLPHWGIWVAGLGVILALAQLALEGARWQMGPAYLGVAAAWLASRMLSGRQPGTASRPAGDRGRRALGWLRASAARGIVLLLGVCGVALPILLPVFDLPEPSGRYAVGRVGFHLEDHDREELFTPASGDHRIIAVEAWYPAEPSPESRPDPYWPLPKERSRTMAGSWGLPSFLFSHLALVDSHGHRDSPLVESDGLFPVLVFSHGLTEGYPEQNSALLEALASHGYVVFSIAHTYESLLVVLPDGSHAPLDQRIEAEFLTDLDRIMPLRDSLTDLEPEAAAEVMAEMFRSSGAVQRSIDIWRQDTLLLLDALEGLRPGAIPSQLAGRLDLERIGVFGMSFGGATAGEVCLHDQRVKAGANLDGYHYGTALTGASTAQPFMTMMSRQGVRYRNGEFARRARGGGILVQIPAANHFDFSDFTLFGNLFRLLPLLGDIPPGEMLQITEAYVLGFFDHYLRGRSIEPLIENPPSGVVVERLQGTASEPIQP